jgi:hypothetical protein
MAGSRVPRAFQIDLAVALAGAVEDAVELQAGEAEVGRDPVFVLLGDVEAQEDVAVAGGPELLDDPADQVGPLADEEIGERAGARGDGVGQGVAVGLGLAPGPLAVVLDGEAPGDLGDEAGEPRRLPQLIVAQLLEDEAERVLEQILGLGPAVGVAVEQDRDAAAVDLDQALFGPPVSRQDPRDQLLRLVGVEVRVQKRFPSSGRAF